MTDKTCVKCGRMMRPIKNGFHHLGPDGGVRSGDLWGCRWCKRFQLHGVPKGQFPWWPLYARVKGEETVDPENDVFSAYLEPEFDFQAPFYEHMKKWYGDFPKEAYGLPESD